MPISSNKTEKKDGNIGVLEEKPKTFPQLFHTYV